MPAHLVEKIFACGFRANADDAPRRRPPVGNWHGDSPARAAVRSTCLPDRRREKLAEAVNRRPGHNAPAIIGVLAVLCLQRIADQRVQTVMAAVFVGLIGFSRVYFGVHWPPDVLGGWLIAGARLILCLTVRHICIRRGGRRPVPTA